MGHPLWKNPRPSHPPVGTSRFQYLGVNVSPKLKDLFHLNFSPLLKKNFYVGIYVSFNFNNINAHSVPRTCIIHNTLRAWQDVKTICGSRVGVFMLAPLSSNPDLPPSVWKSLLTKWKKYGIHQFQHLLTECFLTSLLDLGSEFGTKQEVYK